MARFGVLGPLVVSAAGEVLDVPGGMPHRILAVLLVRAGRPVAMDTIVDELWAGSPPRTARKTAQGYVHHLRRGLDRDDRIRHGNAGYTLIVRAGELDVDRFSMLVSEAGGAAPEVADRLLDEALALWRGPAFADVTGVPMVVAERARLDDLRLAALHRSVGIGLALGRHHQLVPRLREAAAQWPFHESIHEQLMVALQHCGRPTDALEVYGALRRALVTELGVEPGARLRERHRRILRG